MATPTGQHARKAPRERSDEEIGAVPVESVHLERKATGLKKRDKVNGTSFILSLIEGIFSVPSAKRGGGSRFAIRKHWTVAENNTLVK